MKFEFCGKLDCPDWILAQLFHASRMDLHIFELLCQIVNETIEVNEGQLDESQMFDRLSNSACKNQSLDGTVSGNKSNLHFSDFFDIDDIRCCFAAIHFIITNASQYKVSRSQLETELEQLGLSVDHCQVICQSITM